MEEKMSIFWDGGNISLVANEAVNMVEAEQKKTLPVIVIIGIIALALFFFVRSK